MSPKKERVTHYVLRYGDGNASLIRVIWSSAEEVMPAYIEANAVLKPRRLWEKLQNNAAMPHLPVQPMMQHSADVDLCISLVASAQNSFVRKLLSISRQVHITFVFLWLQETAMVNNTIVLPNSQILTTRGIWSFMTQQAMFNYFRCLRLYLRLPLVSGMGAK